MAPPRIAVYAGSFDPFTNGHLDITRRAAKLFDQLIVAVGENPKKRYMLSLQQRMDIIGNATGALSHVSVDRFQGLLVHYCEKIGANVIVRGLRSNKDLDFEMPIAMANHNMLPTVETVFLLSDPVNTFVSSSIVREIATHGGDIRPYVPATAADEIAAVLSR
jgi:pantetheine-phosphate adenylyltransferase